MPAQHTVPVYPRHWLHQRLKLLGEISTGDTLAEGDWIVMFYHHNCSHCRRALDRWLAMPPHERTSYLRQALVEVPPYGPLREVAVAQSRGYLVG